MNIPRDEHSDRQLEVLREVEREDGWIDGDVIEIAKDRWVIHGVIPYEGEVELAVFETYEEARLVLGEVPQPTQPASDA
jgi:hypothetical protein